jgi:hypothetical protein
MRKLKSPSGATAEVIGGVFLSLLVGIVGGALCGAMILSFGDVIGRSGDTGQEYVGFWSMATVWLGMLYGGFLGALVGPLAYLFLVRRIGYQKALLPAFLGTILGGFAGALAGPPLAALTGIVGFFLALSWKKSKLGGPSPGSAVANP